MRNKNTNSQSHNRTSLEDFYLEITDRELYNEPSDSLPSLLRDMATMDIIHVGMYFAREVQMKRSDFLSIGLENLAFDSDELQAKQDPTSILFCSKLIPPQ